MYYHLTLTHKYYIYNNSEGFKLEYYQTTFDYDYCIRQRLKGNFIILSQNDILRNSNYKVLERKILFMTVSTYDKDLEQRFAEGYGCQSVEEVVQVISEQFPELQDHLALATVKLYTLKSSQFTAP